MSDMRAYRVFSGQAWPVPGDRCTDLQWQLRYGTLTKQDLLLAASYLAAFEQLVALPQRERNDVVRELRKGPNRPSKAGANKTLTEVRSEGPEA